MKTPICPVCAGKQKRNGKTTAGKQRWRCTLCNASKTHKIDSRAKHLKSFLDWLLSRKRLADMPGTGKTFRRNTAEFWKLWPLPQKTGEIYRVVYVDGFYLGRKAVILIARNDDYVLSCYIAKSENKRAWKALLRGIAPPSMVVTDGGSGLASAVKEIWPQTAVQRCLFHVFCQIRRYTTARARLPVT